ncbi:hypothetical protein MMC20_004708 [Loxospora ochrophaea]|nr:hypothetical protein [Loxospora ochrophaea]
MSEPALPTVSLDPTFNRARHVKYHLRCLKTLLPTPYTTTDANRMSLATFTVCALDLLSELIPNTTEAERQAYIDWIYRCQHPDGGFRGFTGTNFSHAKKREQVNEAWDTANLAGTFFAFMALVVLGDGLERVRRRECLEWVRRLQLQDGSFGEGRGEGGNVVGSGDLRYAYFAAATRWVLDGGREGKVDIDVDGLVGFVRRSQTYDGGLGQAPYHEAHGGEIYCGIGTLFLLGRLPLDDGEASQSHRESAADRGFLNDIVHWLVYRQTSTIEEEDDEDDDNFSLHDTEDANQSASSSHSNGAYLGDGVQILGPPVGTPEPQLHALPPSASPLESSPSDLNWAGFSGRCNKVADTCYSFWIGAALAMLHRSALISITLNTRYLLEKTQHIVGGFGKLPGDPPDILHSSLGLAALSLMGSSGLKPVEPSLCISVEARERLEGLPWRKRRDATSESKDE